MIANFYHVAIGFAGLMLLYVGLFLTETEEGHLQNRLEELWVRVDDLESKAMTRQAAFLQQVSGLVADGLVKLFGEKLFSFKSLATCLCFSIASLYLSLALSEVTLPLLSKTTLLIFSLVFLILGFLRKLRYLSFVALTVGWLFQLIGLQGELKIYRASLGELISTILVYVVGILSVMGFIALTRWSLRLGSRISSTAGIAAIILLNIALGAILAGPPVFAEMHRYRIVLTLGPRVGTSLFSRPHGFLIFLFGISNINLFTAAFAMIIVLALLTALVHRLVWPAISRPIYAAHRYGFITQHKLLATLGCTCLLFAWPNNIFVKAIAKAAHLVG